MEWLAKKIEEDSRSEARTEWEKLLCELREIRERRGISWTSLGMAVKHCAENMMEPPEQMVEDIREQIYRELKENSPFRSTDK